MTIASIFDVIVVGIFGPNYLLFLVTIFLVIAFIIFAYRYSGPEALLVANAVSYGLYASHINPLFTTIFATIMLVDAGFFVLYVWRRLANG